MPRVLLARHAKSHANARNPAFGNEQAPLDEKGEEQALTMNGLFKSVYGITPEAYASSVLCSTFIRTRQTAQLAGFQNIETDKLIDESALPPGMLRGHEIVLKHASERWAPDEVMQRSRRFIELVRDGCLGYRIVFTHGLYIASVLLNLASEYEARGYDFPIKFSETRGFIPDLATITPLEI